jgi:hypothetical protein
MLSKTTMRCGCSLGAAGSTRRTPEDFFVRKNDAAPQGYHGVLARVRIPERERERERENVRGLPRIRSTQFAYAHIKAKCSGEAERRGEGGFGGLPDYNTTRPRAQQAKRSGEGAFLRLQYNTTRHGATTRATSSSLRRLSSKFSALDTPAKPNRDFLRNALLSLCSKLRTPHGSTFLGPFVCGARAFSLCS